MRSEQRTCARVARVRREPVLSNPNRPPLRIRRQLARFGFPCVADYHRWCRERGFPTNRTKSWDALQQEWCVRSQELREAARRAHVDRDPVAVLVRVCAGDATSQDLARPSWQALARRIEVAGLCRGSRDALRRLVERLGRRANLVLADGRFGGETLPFLQGLIALARSRALWLRSPDGWKPRSHNARRQFASLTRHLVARYDVPAFLDAAWLREDPAAERYRDWYVRVGTGERLAGADAPLRMTRRVAHHFLLAPEELRIEHALRRAQVLALGGDECLAAAVLGSRLGRRFEHEDFWATVIGWLVAHPELDRSHVGPIVDFVHHHRFEPQRVFVAPGVREERAPLRPHMSLRGRSVRSLLRAVDEWHRSLGKQGVHEGRPWAASGIGGFERETGREGRDLRVWRIRELLSPQELHREGRVMRHCVSLYTGACRSGRCSIWTLERESFGRVDKHLTLEVNGCRITQIRGRANRLPRSAEMAVVRAWARREDLEIASWAERVED